MVSIIHRVVVILVGCGTVSLALLFVGPLLVEISDAEPVVGGDLAIQLSNAVAAADQAVSMLFALTFGMFVIVGLLLKDAPPAPLGQLVVAPGAFFLLSAAGLYFGFLARMAVLSKANYSTLPLEGVENMVGRQGMAVALSAVPMLVICYDLLLSSKAK